MRGFNVAVIGLQIPLEALVNVAAPFTARHFGQSIASHGVGVWASVEAAVPIGRGNSQRKRTDWEQVARVGLPLFAMTILDATERARYATSRPEDDAQFATHAESPAIAGYINRYHSPPLDPLQTGGRSDLVALLIPDLLRVDLTTGPVPLPGMTGFNRLGMLAGDITLGRSSGWPNGRRIGDDVVDIYLTALASGPGYGAMRLFGDNVAANDQLFNQVFPYLGTPHSGVANR